MQYFGCSVNIIFVIVALLLFQRIFLFHVQFVNGMNTSYVQIRNELASEQLIKVQFQVAMSGRYTFTLCYQYPCSPCCSLYSCPKVLTRRICLTIKNFISW